MSDVRNLVFGPCQTCLRPICQCPAKHTPPPDAQAMTREQLEKVVQHHTIGWGPYSKVNPLLEHDAAQRETIRRLEVERDEAWAHHRGHCRIAEAYNEEMKTLQARLTASEAQHKDDLRHYQASVMQLLRLVTPAPMESWKQSIIDKANHLIGTQGPLTPGEE